MDTEDIKFKNETHTSENNTNSVMDSEIDYIATKRNTIKNRIMKKYNITEVEAEQILKNIETKHVKNYENKLQSNSQPIEKFKNKKNNSNITKDTTNKNQTPQKSMKKDIIADNDKTIQPPQVDYKTEEQNVDSIISNLIPDYGEQISIELDQVNLTFDVITDKIDTLKETFIRTLKRNKNEKVKLHVLKDISFKIYKGEKVGIIGYNGAGKSTLLNVITGIYSPDSGTVKTYGKISPLLSLGAGFDHNYSGSKNIFLNGAVLGYDKEFIKEKYDEIVEFSELGDSINYPIKNYSSGMLAKLGFSIATIVEPDILIIDEILGVGDVNFNKKSSDKIKSLMDGRTTVLLVSHSIGQIRELCEKAIWIDNGRVKEIGEVNRVCDHYLKDAEKASNKQLKNIQLK